METDSVNKPDKQVEEKPENQVPTPVTSCKKGLAGQAGDQFEHPVDQGRVEKSQQKR